MMSSLFKVLLTNYLLVLNIFMHKEDLVLDCNSWNLWANECVEYQNLKPFYCV